MIIYDIQLSAASLALMATGPMVDLSKLHSVKLPWEGHEHQFVVLFFVVVVCAILRLFWNRISKAVGPLKAFLGLDYLGRGGKRK